MTVFISWAGAPSKQLAVALRRFLRVVVQPCSPWMSERDIGAGETWDAALEGALQRAKFGIVCLTPSNLTSVYLHYEAGAIANQVGHVNRVCPVLLGFEHTAQVGQPLGRFQAKVASKDGIWDLVEAVNGALETPIDNTTLREAFDGQWDRFQTEISAIRMPVGQEVAPRREQVEILDEILDHIRELLSRTPPLIYQFAGSTLGDLARPPAAYVVNNPATVIPSSTSRYNAALNAPAHAPYAPPIEGEKQPGE